MITKRSARTVREAIMDARKFVRLCNLGYTGLESRNLTGLYGKAYQRAWRQASAEQFVRLLNADPLLGRYDGGLWMKPNDVAKLGPGVRVEHEGKSGTIVLVDNLGVGGSTEALVDWDSPMPDYAVFGRAIYDAIYANVDDDCAISISLTLRAAKSLMEQGYGKR